MPRRAAQTDLSRRRRRPPPIRALALAAVLLSAPSTASAKVGACDANLTLRRAAFAHLDHVQRFVTRDELALLDVREPDSLTGTLVIALDQDAGRFCVGDAGEYDAGGGLIRTFTFRGGLSGADIRLLYGNNELSFGDAAETQIKYTYHAVGSVVRVADAVEVGVVGVIQGGREGPGQASGWSFSVAAPYAAANVRTGDGLDRAALRVGAFGVGPVELAASGEYIGPLEVAAAGIDLRLPLVERASLVWAADASGSLEVAAPTLRRAHLGTEVQWPGPRSHAKGGREWRLAARAEGSLFDGTHVAPVDGPLPGGLLSFDASYQVGSVLFGVDITVQVAPERLEFLPGETPVELLLSAHLSALGAKPLRSPRRID